MKDYIGNNKTNKRGNQNILLTLIKVNIFS